MGRMPGSGSGRQLPLAAMALAIFAAAAVSSCGGSSGAAATTSSAASTPVTAKAPCTVVVVMAAVSLVYDHAGTQASLPAGGGDLRCASGIARIQIFIGPVNPPQGGPQGSPHLVLLEDQRGTWVVANSVLCSSNGQPTRAIPASLGTVCGVQ